MKKHTEARLEDAIIDHLTTQGGYVLVDYREGEAKDRYDKARALDPALVIGFIQATQKKMWRSLEAIDGAETGRVVLDHLVKELDTKGMLKLLRQGFKWYGKKLLMAVFAPNNRMTPDTLTLYGKNGLSVTRQLYYGEEHYKSFDLVLFLNGLPIATAELKDPLFGQTVEDAKKQYKKDRDHGEFLFDFTKRTLVHFAVDQDLVFMTTRLSGELHAVSYKQAFDKYITEKGYTDVRTLVAFSAIQEDPDQAVLRRHHRLTKTAKIVYST